jgi:peptidoglycan/LPS O-acetylase OafA/YrhL
MECEGAAFGCEPLVKGSSLQKTELKYRSDIDGLRALAVLLVLGFHLEMRQFSGGFIGVDVFFVISGYLITGIIAKEIDASRFSILGFYERRVRRILPALFAVMAASSLLIFRYLLPSEVISYAKSMLGATFSYSNFYFWSTSDYFDAPAHTKPLLHTWSLAVEEQFYVVLPLLLLFLARQWSRRRNSILVALALLSLGWSAWSAYHSPDAAFYLPVSRAWELLTGSLLALNIVPAIHSRWARETSSLVGLALICYAAVFYTSTTPFPGFAALLPCVGSAMILASGRHGSSMVGKILSLKPITFIGLISYSVYLWHWPLIVFTKMGFLPEIPRRHIFYVPIIVALSLILGYLSWRFIEQPFRVGRLRQLARPKLLGGAALAMAAYASVALSFLFLHGLPSRFPAKAIDIADVQDSPEKARLGTCFITGKQTFEQFRSDMCLQTDPAKENYLLLGDSHSAVLWYALAKQMPAAKILQASVSGCKPVLGGISRGDCGRMMHYIFDDFLPTHSVQGVFLTARWSSEKDFENAQAIVTWCARHKVELYIIGPVVEYDAPLPKLLAYSIALHDPNLPEQHMRTDFFDLDARMKHKAEDDWKVHYISLIDAECPARKCLDYADAAQTASLMQDDNHLSNAGSMLVMQKILQAGQLPASDSRRANEKVAKVSLGSGGL